MLTWRDAEAICKSERPRRMALQVLIVEAGPLWDFLEEDVLKIEL